MATSSLCIILLCSLSSFGRCSFNCVTIPAPLSLSTLQQSLYRTVICEIGSRTYSIISGKSSPNESSAVLQWKCASKFSGIDTDMRTRVQIHTVLYRHTYAFCHYPHFLTPSLPAASPSLLLTLALSPLLSLSLSLTSLHTCSEWTAVWCSTMYQDRKSVRVVERGRIRQ